MYGCVCAGCECVRAGGVRVSACVRGCVIILYRYCHQWCDDFGPYNNFIMYKALATV